MCIVYIRAHHAAEPKSVRCDVIWCLSVCVHSVHVYTSVCLYVEVVLLNVVALPVREYVEFNESRKVSRFSLLKSFATFSSANTTRDRSNTNLHLIYVYTNNCSSLDFYVQFCSSVIVTVCAFVSAYCKNKAHSADTVIDFACLFKQGTCFYFQTKQNKRKSRIIDKYN